MGTENQERSKIEEWRHLVHANEIVLKEYYSQLLMELKELNNQYQAFYILTFPSEDSLKEVASTELLGLPFSAKDNLCTKNVETTAGSKILKGYIPPFNATAVENLNKAGGILIGKTAMDEFGFGTFSLNSGFEIPRNAYDPTLVAGGSSGGAAVATALIEYHVALAVSTGGSITCPATFNGVVGLTPTYGRVSRWGLIDYANSLDKVGVMARYTADTQKIFDLISSYDEKDLTCVQVPKTEKEKRSECVTKNGTPLKLGILQNTLESLQPPIKTAFLQALERLERNYDVITYEEVELKSLKYALASYYIIAMTEASTNLARYCGMRYGVQPSSYETYFDELFTEIRSQYFGEEAKRRIILGTFARMAGYRDKYYLKALKIRTILIKEYKALFETRQIDAILSPAMPILPPRIADVGKLKPIEIYNLDILTVPPNLCGFPHLSVPIDYYENKIPIGMQIIANHFNESILFEIGKKWEHIFAYRTPPTTIGKIQK